MFPLNSMFDFILFYLIFTTKIEKKKFENTFDLK